jgi:predicted nucleic-acid-binding protein
MIGLDTNILLRAVLDDDAAQSPLAVAFLSKLSSDEPGLVNDVTLAEFVWTLERTADYSRNEISSALRSMLSSPSYRFFNRLVVSKALTRFDAEKKTGFVDALIGEINRAAGCSTTFTFDGGAAKTDLFSPIPL